MQKTLQSHNEDSSTQTSTTETTGVIKRVFSTTLKVVLKPQIPCNECTGVQFRKSDQPGEAEGRQNGEGKDGRREKNRKEKK